MILRCYAIYDEKAEAFKTPFFMPAVGMAVRAFENLRKEPTSEVSRNPDDYTLWYVSAFDDQNAEMVGATVVQCVCPRSDGSFPAILVKSQVEETRVDLGETATSDMEGYGS